MSDYTETFSNNPGDTILAAEFQTEFTAIQTALATKADKSDAANTDGSDATGDWWFSSVATARTAGLGETVTTLTPITLTAADVALNINAALGNVFVVHCIWNGNKSLLLANPTNPIDGQEITLIVVRDSGSATPDFTIIDDGTEILSADNGYKGTTFGASIGGTATRANLYRMLRADGVWLCWCEQTQIVMT